MLALLFTQVFVTLLLTGLIWTVQVVHYPLFRKIPAEVFKEYEQEHQKRISYLVVPFMLIELFVSSALVYHGWNQERWLWHLTGFILVLAIWLQTFLVAAPMHGKLAEGKNDKAIEILVRSNWWRVLFWSVRAVLVLYLIYNWE